MATVNAASTVSGWLKEVYADNLQSLIPEGVRLLKLVKYSAGELETGNYYHQPVALTHEHGFSVGAGAVTLNAAIAASYADAQVIGKNVYLRTQVAYDVMSRASNSKKSFVKWAEQVVGNMTSSFTKRLEILHFYGGTSIGKVSAITSGVITMTTATWAPGIWAGSEGMILAAWTALTSGSQHDGDLVISAVDLTARTVTVTGTSSAVAADDFLFYKAFRGSEMSGLDSIITNTGTLHNISATTYALWKGNSLSAASGRLTFAKIQQALALGVARGLDEKVVCFCSVASFADLNTDLAAAQQFDSNYSKSKGEMGFETIKFYGANGEVEIVPSIYVKEGEAFLVPPARLKRIGSTDVTMKMPGKEDADLVLQVPDTTAYELRMYYDGNLFCERPSWCTKVTGIVNAA